MYQLGVQRDFMAQHYLVGGDFGAENRWHSHHYRLEVVVDGERLDGHGYLTNIDDVRAAMDGLVRRYRDRTLNELPEFEGLNPSLEHFARILGSELTERLDTSRLTRMRVVLWEDGDAWASWQQGAVG